MAQEFNFAAFLARSTDTSFEDTALAKVLVALPKLDAWGPWLAGGALRRAISGLELHSDFDFFFQNAEQLGRFKGALEDKGLRVRKETDHHIELRGKIDDENRIIQLIRFAYYADARAVIDSFDFTICQFAFDGQILTAGDFALWDLGRKRLAVHKITYPLSTMRRTLKYAKQGFNACPGALTAILKATTDNPALLEQLQVEYVD